MRSCSVGAPYAGAAASSHFCRSVRSPCSSRSELGLRPRLRAVLVMAVVPTSFPLRISVPLRGPLASAIQLLLEMYRCSRQKPDSMVLIFDAYRFAQLLGGCSSVSRRVLHFSVAPKCSFLPGWCCCIATPLIRTQKMSWLATPKMSNQSFHCKVAFTAYDSGKALDPGLMIHHVPLLPRAAFSAADAGKRSVIDVLKLRSGIS